MSAAELLDFFRPLVLEPSALARDVDFRAVVRGSARINLVSTEGEILAHEDDGCAAEPLGERQCGGRHACTDGKASVAREIDERLERLEVLEDGKERSLAGDEMSRATRKTERAHDVVDERKGAKDAR